MERSDRDKIQKNIVPLSKLVNVSQVAELLIRKGVIDHEFLERIQGHPTTFQKNQEFFLMYTKRGPKAFSYLVQALMETGHVSEARLLDEEQYLRVGGSRGHRSRSRERIGSVESASESESLSGSENSGSGSGVSGGGGVRPIWESPEASESSSAGASAEKSGSPPVSPTTCAMGQLNIGISPEAGSTSTLENGTIPPPPLASPSPSPINTTPIRRATKYNQGKLLEDEAYPMMSSPRGYALIINNINFPSDPEDMRRGAQHDTENLRLLFEELGFRVTVRLDVTRDELTHPCEGILVKFRSQFDSHPRVDAGVVVIMSHGMEESKIRTSDPGHTHVHLYHDVIAPFNNLHCPALKGKPKLFIVQTCRGDARDRGKRCRSATDGKKLEATMSSSSLSASVGDGLNDFTPPLSCPSTEDILICFPTIPGYVANRDTELGTWYVQCFVEAFRAHAHDLEVTSILRKVGRRMRMVENELGEKQMCCFKHIGFHRELYFNPGIFADE